MTGECLTHGCEHVQDPDGANCLLCRTGTSCPRDCERCTVELERNTPDMTDDDQTAAVITVLAFAWSLGSLFATAAVSVGICSVILGILLWRWN